MDWRMMLGTDVLGGGAVRRVVARGRMSRLLKGV